MSEQDESKEQGGNTTSGPSEVDSYLAECVVIDSTVIQEEFIRLPSDLAYWNAQYADALRGFLKAKIVRDRVKAELYLEVRQTFEEEGVKATEAKVAATVEQDREYIDACLAFAEAEANKARMFGAVDAIRSKKEMLISLGAQLRTEMEGDPLLRDQVRGRKMS